MLQVEQATDHRFMSPRLDEKIGKVKKPMSAWLAKKKFKPVVNLQS